jgi:hypothetical protein
LLPPFTEVESGKNSDRPQLRAAMDRCRKTGATLLIARLDRLARNVRFISALMEEGIPFVACDMPTATPFMLHVYAAVSVAAPDGRLGGKQSARRRIMRHTVQWWRSRPYGPPMALMSASTRWHGD